LQILREQLDKAKAAFDSTGQAVQYNHEQLAVTENALRGFAATVVTTTARVRDYERSLNDIPTDITTTVHLNKVGDSPPQQKGPRAAGGLAQPGVYRVGEHGPEEVVINGNNTATVKRNDQIGSGGSGGGNVTVVVYGVERSYVQQLALEIDKLRREGR
jgi:hypothetical protein